MSKIRTAAVSLFLGALGSSPVLAAPTGSQTLGVGESSITDVDNTDVWQLVCAGGTSWAQAYVSDTSTPYFNAAALMSVFVVNLAGGVGAFAIDISEGGASSPWADAGTGPGIYQVTFSKSASGDESYSGEAQCVGSTPTSFTRTQNQ